jgi:hypothetical protein
VNYNLTSCYICRGLMSFRQVREAVYWLPDMDYQERLWASYEGFVHRFAHRACWKRLKERKRELIRLCSYKNQEPQSMGQRV